MPNVILSASGISKGFGGAPAVKNVSLEVNEGEILGLLGPNGAGKTTLSKILAGLLRQDNGSVSFFGLGKDASDPEVKRLIALVPQEPGFYRSFTARQNIEFFSLLYGMKRKNAAETAESLIKWMKLSDFSEKRSEFLSGGYQHLLNIACSLVNNPKIIFMDEPTVGLDPKMRQIMWEKILELKKNGKTVILTTHYMDEAEELCDRVALMGNGQISVIDSPRALISKYGGKTIIVFRLSGNVEPGLLKAAENAIPGSIARGRQSSLILTVKQADVTKAIVKLAELIEGLGYEIKENIVKEPELENVFLNLMDQGIKESP